MPRRRCFPSTPLRRCASKKGVELIRHGNETYTERVTQKTIVNAAY
jgi:hypothetical protein